MAITVGCGDHSNNAHYVSKQLDPYDLATDCSGTITPFLRCHFYIKTPSLCQDRLGTNIGTTQKESGVFL